MTHENIRKKLISGSAQQHRNSNIVMDCPFLITSGLSTSGSDLGPLSLLFISPLLGALFNDVCQGFITLLSYSVMHNFK